MSTRPESALRMLLEGNARFVSGHRRHPHQDADRRAVIAPAQRPFALLFGCSDSRMAAEIIFDRGLGDLFVVRTAGHVVGPEVLGSIEYAVEALDVPLIVVLGHDSCGAVAAAMDALASGSFPKGAIRDVIERVMLSLVGLRDRVLSDTGVPAVPAGRVIDEHVRYTVDLLARRSSLIADRLASRTCGLVGLRYDLLEGTVHEVDRHGV